MTNIRQQCERYYENVEINVTTGTTNQVLSTTAGVSFRTILNPTTNFTTNPTAVVIRTNNTISIRLNSTSSDSITITSTDSPYEISGIEITEVYITNNSGSTAAVRMFFQPTKY